MQNVKKYYIIALTLLSILSFSALTTGNFEISGGLTSGTDEFKPIFHTTTKAQFKLNNYGFKSGLEIKSGGVLTTTTNGTSGTTGNGNEKIEKAALLRESNVWASYEAENLKYVIPTFKLKVDLSGTISLSNKLKSDYVEDYVFESNLNYTGQALYKPLYFNADFQTLYTGLRSYDVDIYGKVSTNVKFKHDDVTFKDFISNNEDKLVKSDGKQDFNLEIGTKYTGFSNITIEGALINSIETKSETNGGVKFNAYHLKPELSGEYRYEIYSNLIAFPKIKAEADVEVDASGKAKFSATLTPSIRIDYLQTEQFTAFADVQVPIYYNKSNAFGKGNINVKGTVGFRYEW
ncbi:hypothetical protein [Caviibacter abscessus]|uniref:hypothetical protein n=1 Tax=Caviibacter abscessus TaxID=1766719 RepID=UPI0008393DA2|nr:hypothetical protein [Caviibacter abscessus]